jgi:sec-independent protein translocase protein TatA
MGPIGPMQILIIVLIILLLFGATKLPNLARSMGRSMRIFKSEVREMKNDDKPQIDEASDASEADRIANDFSDDASQSAESVDPGKKNDQ